MNQSYLGNANYQDELMMVLRDMSMFQATIEWNIIKQLKQLLEHRGIFFSCQKDCYSIVSLFHYLNILSSILFSQEFDFEKLKLHLQMLPDAISSQALRRCCQKYTSFCYCT